jgi:hypothetical protein
MAVDPILLLLTPVLAAAGHGLLEPLRAAGATSPDHAIPLAIHESARGARMESLLRSGVIVEAYPGRYYIDESALARSTRSGRPGPVGVVLGIAAVAGLAALARFLRD